MQRSKIIGAVEIGTSKVVVLIGEVVGGRALNIVGRGQSTSAGIKKGEIHDLRALSDCAHAAICAAEKSAAAQIEGVYLSQSGRHLQAFANSGTVGVSDPDGFVMPDDLRRATEDAKAKALPPGRAYIHHIRSSYLLDGQPVESPLHLKGSRLEVGYWHIHGDERRLADYLHVINGCGLPVEDMIVSSIASGSMVTTEEEKQHGVLVVDIVGGTTDFVLYKDGCIRRTGVIPVGGDHLTNDLALGLRVNWKHAESLKLRHGKALPERTDKSEMVMLVGDLMIGDRPVPKLAIARVLQARVEEIFKIIVNRLGSAVSPQNLAGGVILTGGSSRLPLIDKAAEQVFGVDCRLGRNPEWVSHEELREPEYSTALGLLYYGLRNQKREDAPETRRSGLFSRMADIFR